MYYGYCHETRRMRMMDATDYMNNLQTGYTNLYSNPASAMQPIIDALATMMRGQGSTTSTATSMPQGHHKRHHKHGCGCHEDDCGCSCCIRCADIVEYARCGESRRIPITFDNDTRRERAVTLQLGNFATENGVDPGWQASLSESRFTLPPCGEKTVFLNVNVDCGKLGAAPPANNGENAPPAAVDRCRVVYATLRAEGCSVRPLVIAVAVLPDHCGAHHAGCGCGCCCN